MTWISATIIIAVGLYFLVTIKNLQYRVRSLELYRATGYEYERRKEK